MFRPRYEDAIFFMSLIRKNQNLVLNLTARDSITDHADAINFILDKSKGTSLQCSGHTCLDSYQQL